MTNRQDSFGRKPGDEWASTGQWEVGGAGGPLTVCLDGVSFNGPVGAKCSVCQQPLAVGDAVTGEISGNAVKWVWAHAACQAKA